MSSGFEFLPGIAIRPGLRILIAGASGGIGKALLTLLARTDCTVGAHCRTDVNGLQKGLDELGFTRERAHVLQAELTAPAEGISLVEQFVQRAGGIDALVQLTGGISRPIFCLELDPGNWENDLRLNLTVPFFMAQTAMKLMKGRGGKIILTSTASAQHGGGTTSLAYGVAKAGIECVTKGLARVGAPDRILVNAMVPGYIETPFHSRWKPLTPADKEKRVSLIPLKRAGQPSEVAAGIIFLLSEAASYMTGECLTMSGGDWL